MPLSDTDLILKTKLEIQKEGLEKDLNDLQKRFREMVKERDKALSQGHTDSNTERGIGIFAKKIQNTTAELANVNGQLNELDKKSKTTFNDMSNEMGIAEKSAVRLTQAVAGILTLRMAKQFAQRVLSVRGEFQQLEVAFETILGSKEKAEKMMSEAVTLAAKTPFDLKGVAAGANALLAYGMNADDVTETLRRLGDVAAGLGLPLDRLTQLYGQTFVKGKLITRDLIRYQAAGIPMLDELAKMYGKTNQEMQKMITAGKVGFADVQKVMVKMTSAGGKFANLMEKQSKTITGQISNIQDAIDVMFNEIGEKSSGVINKALEGASWMVENYEKVGKALGVVIALYGVEKAALMALAAAKSVKTKADIAEIAATKGATVAQLELNKAILASPYTIAALAVAGLVVGIWKLSTACSAATSAQKELEKGSVELDDTYTKEMATLNRLKGRLEGAEKGTKAWNDAKDEAVREFSKYRSTIGQEIDEVGNLTDAYHDLSIEIANSAKVRGYSAFVSTQSSKMESEVTNTLSTIQKGLNKYFKGDEEKAGTLFSKVIGVIYGDEAGLTQEEKGILNKVSSKYAFSLGLWTKNLNQMVDFAREDIKKLNTLNEDAKAAFGITDEMIEKYEEGPKAPLTTPDKDEKPSDKAKAAAYRASERAKSQAKKLERERIDLQFAADQAVIDAMNEGAAKTLKANELNYQKEMEQLRRQREDKLEELREAEKQEWLAQDPENRKEYDFKTTIATLPKEYEDLYDEQARLLADKRVKADKDALDKLLDNYAGYDRQRRNIEKKYSEDLAALEANRSQMTAAQYHEAVYTLEKQKTQELYNLGRQESATYKRIFADIDTMSREAVDATIGLAERELEKMIALGDASVEDIAEISKRLDELREKRDEMDFGGWGSTIGDWFTLSARKNRAGATKASIESQIKAKKVARTDEAFTNGTTTTKFKELSKELKELQRQAEAAADSEAYLEEEMKKVAATVAATSLGKALSQIGDALQEIASVSGNEGLSEAGEALSGIGGMVSNIAEGFASGGLIGGIVTAVTTIASTAMDAFVSVKKAQDEYNKSVKAFNNELEQMTLIVRSTDFTSLFGTSEASLASDAYNKARTAINKFTAASRKLANLNVKTEDYSWFAELFGKSDKYSKLKNFDIWGKDGLLDVDKAKAFLNTQTYITDEIKAEVEEVIALKEAYEDAMDVVKDYAQSVLGNFASTVGDAICDSILSGVDAFDTLEQAGASVIDTLARSMASQWMMEKYLNQFDDRLISAFGSGSSNAVTDVVADIMRGLPEAVKGVTEMVEGIYDYAERTGIDMDVLRENTQRQAATKSSLGASQESIDESNGRLTAIQGHTYELNENTRAIREQNASLVAYSASLLEHVQGIHIHTGVMVETLREMKALSASIKSGMTTILDSGVVMR